MNNRQKIVLSRTKKKKKRKKEKSKKRPKRKERRQKISKLEREENRGLGSHIGKRNRRGQMITRRIEQRRKCVWNDNDCCNDCPGPLYLLNTRRDFNCRLSIAVRLGIPLNSFDWHASVCFVERKNSLANSTYDHCHRDENDAQFEDERFWNLI